MPRVQISELTTLRFHGPRFEDHGLEIDVLSELIAYKKLLLETAKELWRRKHPKRKKLPRGFEESISIKFFELGDGSTSVPLMRVIDFEEDKLIPKVDDDLDDAAHVIDSAIEAAGEDRPLPERLPKNVIPLFADFGKSLGEDESIFVKACKRESEVHYTREVRERLMTWVERTYEDVVDITGEVRLADLDGCNFVLRQDDGTKVPGKFDPDQEALITDALRGHASRRLRLRGRAEFTSPKGKIKRIVSMDEATVRRAGEAPYNPTERPIWEIAVELGASLPDDEWAKVPRDLSKNLDHYLYGAPKDEE